MKRRYYNGNPVRVGNTGEGLSRSEDEAMCEGEEGLVYFTAE